MPYQQRRPMRVVIVDAPMMIRVFSNMFHYLQRRAIDARKGFSFQLQSVSDPEQAYDYLTQRGIDILITKVTFPQCRCTFEELVAHALRGDQADWPHILVLDELEERAAQRVNQVRRQHAQDPLGLFTFDRRDPRKAIYDFGEALQASVTYFLEQLEVKSDVSA